MNSNRKKASLVSERSRPRPWGVQRIPKLQPAAVRRYNPTVFYAHGSILTILSGFAC
jgi:hypothetical protein